MTDTPNRRCKCGALVTDPGARGCTRPHGGLMATHTAADTPSSPAEPRDDSYDVCSGCGHSRWLHVSVARNGGCMAKSVRGAPNCRCPAFADRPAPSSSGETPAAATSSANMDDLLHAFQSACAAVVSEGDSNLSRTTKERAILRNELRAHLVTGVERDAECARLRAEVGCYQAAFRSFGQHDYTCPKLRGGSRGCACGYSDLIRKLDAAATPPAGDARGS